MFAKYCIFSDGADNCLARVLFNLCCLNCHWFLYLLADRRGETVGTKPFLLLFKYKIKIWIETAALTRNRPCNVVWRPKFYIKLLLIDTHPLHQAILQNILRKLLSYYIKLLLLDTHPLHTWRQFCQIFSEKPLNYYGNLKQFRETIRNVNQQNSELKLGRESAKYEFESVRKNLVDQE